VKSNHLYDDWLSLIDERNEPALRVAFVAAAAAWAVAFLLTLI
jgi:hypothetical protein